MWERVAYLVASFRAQRCSNALIERRATRAARQLLSDWRPGRAAPAPHHAHGLHRHHAPPPPRATPRATTYPRPARNGLTHHAIIDVFWEMYRAAGSRRQRGTGTHRGRGVPLLRAASRICLNVFLRAPAARHLQRRARTRCAPSAPRKACMIRAPFA